MFMSKVKRELHYLEATVTHLKDRVIVLEEEAQRLQALLKYQESGGNASIDLSTQIRTVYRVPESDWVEDWNLTIKNKGKK